MRKSDPDPEVDAIWLEDVPEEYTESRDEAVEIIIHGDEETIKKNLFPEDQEEKQNQKVDDEVEKRANATSLIVIENNQFPSSGENVGIDFPEVEQEETRDHGEEEANDEASVRRSIRLMRSLGLYCAVLNCARWLCGEHVSCACTCL